VALAETLKQNVCDESTAAQVIRNNSVTEFANLEAAVQTALLEQTQADLRMKLANLSYRLVILLS
jgi:hypothetical protein